MTTISAIRMADPPGDDHPRHPRPLRAAGGHLHVVELSQVGERRQVHALIGLLLADRGVADPADRDPGRVGRRDRAVAPPRRDHGLPVADRWRLIDEVEQQAAGVPDLGLRHALGAVRQHPRRDGASVVGDQGHLGRAMGDVGDPPDQPVPVDHRVVDRHAVAGARVDGHGRVPDRGRARRSPARSPACSRRGFRRGRGEELSQLAVLALGSLRPGQLGRGAAPPRPSGRCSARAR